MFRIGNAPLPVQVVTAAGSSQTDAAAVGTKSPAFILAAGDNTVGIRLPLAAKGMLFYVKNTGGGSLKVYPASGDAINAIVADSPLVMVTVTSAVFVAKDSTTWYTFPLLPS